jgi:hypothetical protein
MSMENVAEEVLDVMFCHYEPPTSERAQLRAAQLARSDPAKYAIRRATKPILKLPSMVKRSANINGASSAGTENIGESILFKVSKNSATPTAPPGDDATTASTKTTAVKKSVTWRDEQNKRNHIEQNVAGCAGGYCGFFKQGEGLADILMSPTYRGIADGAAGPPIPVLKTFSVSAASPAGTMTSTTSNGTGISSPANTIATSVATSTTSMNTKEAASPTSLGTSSSQILYDDLGNPIRRGLKYDDDDELFDEDRNTVPSTPASQQQNATTTSTKSPMNGSNGAAFGDSMHYFFAGPIAAAASIMGVNSANNNSRSNSTSTRSLGMEGVDDRLGVYEPEDYDHPSSSSHQQQLPYRAVRAPTPLKRIPTPRFNHAAARQYGDDGSASPDDAVQTLAKLSPHRMSRSPTLLRDEELGHCPATKGTMNVRVPTSNTPRKTFPSGRSDVYSDITEDEEAYLQKRGATPVDVDDEFLYFYDDKGNLLARRRPQSMRSNSTGGRLSSVPKKLTKDDETKIFDSTPIASTSPRASTLGADGEVPNDPGESQLTPREFFKRLDDANRRNRADSGCKSTARPSISEKDSSRDNTNDGVDGSRQGFERMKLKGEDNDHQDRRLSALNVVTKKDPEPNSETAIGADRARDPTPRNSLAPASGGALPPTPRREKAEKESREVNTPDGRRSSLARQMSPSSMATSAVTDAEIREEVSSVGVMTPSTLRPMELYRNPFLVRDSIPAELPKPELKVRKDPKVSAATSRSTLSSNPSRVSCDKDERQKRISRKKDSRSKSSVQSQHSRSSSRSGNSSQNKKLWRGWKQTVGKVKHVVNGIEEERLPLPLAHHASSDRNCGTKSKSR